MIQGSSFSVVLLKAVQKVPFWAKKDVLSPNGGETVATDGVNNL